MEATESMSAQPNDLQIYQPDAQVGDLKLYKAPSEVMAEAQLAAVELQKIIAAKPKPVIFNGEQYLEHEDWEMLGHFYGYATKGEWTRYVEFECADGGKIRGYEASALLINERTGNVVGRAEAMCLDDEENWGMVPEYEWRDVIRTDDQGKATKVWDQAKGKYLRERVQVGEKPKPLNQIRSMAQTRASAKAFRTKLAWVAVLAGYKPTPACEMTTGTATPTTDALPEKLERKQAPLTPDTAQTKPIESVRQPAAQPVQAVPVPPRPAPSGVISPAKARRFYAIWKQAGKSREQVVAYLRQSFGIDDDRLIPESRYNEVCKWAEGQ